MYKKSILSQEDVDAILVEYYESVSDETIRSVKSIISIYEQYHGTKLVELLNEALSEQRERVSLDQLSLYSRLKDFRTDLLEERKYNTIKKYMSMIKRVYKLFRVEIPYLPPLNKKKVLRSEFIEFEDIITLKQIKKALAICKPAIKARCMAMITGGYNFGETQDMTIKKFIKDNYRHHGYKDEEAALLYLAESDNCIWLNKRVRGKSGKPYYGFTNPETTQEIAKYVLSTDYQERKNLFEYTYDWVRTCMGEVNDILGFPQVADMKLFRCHMLRKFNGSHLSGVKLDDYQMTNADIDELQGRGKTQVQDSYIKSNKNKLELLYCKALNNISIYNKYDYHIVGENKIEVECITHKKEEILQQKVDKMTHPTNGLNEYVQEVGVEVFKKQIQAFIGE